MLSDPRNTQKQVVKTFPGFSNDEAWIPCSLESLLLRSGSDFLRNTESRAARAAQYILTFLHIFFLVKGSAETEAADPMNHLNRLQMVVSLKPNLSAL